MGPVNDASHRRAGIVVGWLLLFPLLSASLSAKSPGFHPPELEHAISRASLILVARAGAASETRVVSGGKAEQVIRTFDFEPVKTIKGIFMRDRLSLTSEDLGDSVWTPDSGQLRLLLLGRSSTGYQNVYRQATLDRSLPLLDNLEDPLLKTVELLITVTQEYDRGRKVDLLLTGLGTTGGPGAIPLLDSLRYRALLAVQHPEAAVIAVLVSDPSPEVRTAAARTLGTFLEADYLENGPLADQAIAALDRLLESSDPFLPARLAALDALGVARSETTVRRLASRQLRLEPHRMTFTEQAAVVQAVGRQQMDSLTDAILGLVEQMELDAPHHFQQAAETALIQLSPQRAAGFLEGRIRDKHRAGLEAEVEIRATGELPADEAISVLLTVPVANLSRLEKTAFALACQKVKDGRLVPPLTILLEPRLPDVHWQVVEALRKIDTGQAAQALTPYLRQEANLHRKLEIAEFLGRHGIDAGSPYALEHMSQPHLLEPAIAVLVAISTPEIVTTLRGIVKTSNDLAWTGASIRALGALQDRELIPQLLDIVEDLRHPLAPYALVALGDSGERKAIETYREGVHSRDEEIVVASVRGAARLLKRGEIDDASLRSDLAALLASADASQGVRNAALKALRDLDDRRLDAALAAAVLDAHLEGYPLLQEIEDLLEDRMIRLADQLGGPAPAGE